MHIGEISFVFGPDHDGDTAVAAIHDLCHALRMNGQTLGREFPLAQQDDTYKLYVMLPAADALSPGHARKWVERGQGRLRAAGQREQIVRVLGPAPDALDPCACIERKSLVLYTTYISLESCLRCGECFDPVPLYTVPPTTDDSFYDVMCWQSDYQSCDGLQMNCATGEGFGLRELGRVDSSLTRRGRSVCRRLEESTGIPVFYHLHRYYGRSARQERERRCPGCGGNWLLDERRHGIFDFGCEPCRLLSNLATA